MLHEVLLALSGHPSPLFNSAQLSNGKEQVTHDFPLLKPSEISLLQSIGRLAERHRQLKYHVQVIAAGHSSMICRAVATSIRQTHLARFQKKIVDVEAKILSKDPSTVGAYNIVPLATIVGEFDDWHRLMLWFWDTACFMQPPSPRHPGTPSQGCTGAGVIDKLRAESLTGYPEIAAAATELNKVAETAWLKQLSSWIVYGNLPTHGSQDFFLSKQDDESGVNFVKNKTLLPSFVTWSTASSILFIGKSINQIKRYNSRALFSKGVESDSDLASNHLQHLSSLSLPINQAQLSRSVSAIRSSLSQNVLRDLLPLQTTMQVLDCLRQFFLLSRGEFAVAIITEASNRLQAREKSMGRLTQQDPVKALKDLSITDAELQQTLAQAWKSLIREDEDVDDALLEFARSHISLSAPHQSIARPQSSEGTSEEPELSTVSFNDLLFPSATVLNFAISPPLDLLLSERETDTYATINAYVLAIRRAQLRLSDLWRRSSTRREHGSAEPANLTTRRREARKIWATCSAANFLIAEISAYLEGEIIRGACDHFEDWVKQPSPSADASSNPRDPETLASGHRSFLSSLAYALLLTDKVYTQELRSLLGNIDTFIAYFARQLDVQQKGDLERDTDGEISQRTADDEKPLALELDRARKKVDSDLKGVVNRLRQLDHERIGSARYWTTTAIINDLEFEPWKGAGGLDRLLMKLEFGRMLDSRNALAMR